MRSVTSLIFSCIALLFSVAQAETILASSVAGDSSWTVSIVGVYQMDDEIWITSDLEKSHAVGYTVISYPSDQISADLPSIVARHVGDLDEVGSENPLILHREQIGVFDFSRGDGWVNTEVVGQIYIRAYPWVRHPALGWLYVSEGPIVGGDNRKKKLSFYFFSESAGWLWKSPYTDQYYSFKTNGFETVKALTVR